MGVADTVLDDIDTVGRSIAKSKGKKVKNIAGFTLLKGCEMLCRYSDKVSPGWRSRYNVGACRCGNHFQRAHAKCRDTGCESVDGRSFRYAAQGSTMIAKLGLSARDPCALAL